MPATSSEGVVSGGGAPIAVVAGATVSALVCVAIIVTAVLCFVVLRRRQRASSDPASLNLDNESYAPAAITMTPEAGTSASTGTAKFI